MVWLAKLCTCSHTHSHPSHHHTLTSSYSLLYSVSCPCSNDITGLWCSNPVKADTCHSLHLWDHVFLLGLIEENAESRTTSPSRPSTTMYIGIYVLYMHVCSVGESGHYLEYQACPQTLPRQRFIQFPLNSKEP